MTVDSAYFVYPIEVVDKTQTHYPIPIESIGDAAMECYALFEETGEKIKLPVSLARFEYETVRDPIFKRCVLVLPDPEGLGMFTGLSVERYTPRVRDLMVLDQNRFPSNEFENQMDKITYMLQELEGHLCDCNTDTVTVRPPAVPIPEQPGGPVDPPVPPTCKVYACDAIDQGVLDLYGLSMQQYWSLGASNMGVPIGTEYAENETLPPADIVNFGATATVKYTFGSINPMTLNDFFFNYNDGSSELKLCVPEGHGGPGGLSYSGTGNYLQIGPDPGQGGGVMSTVNSGGAAVRTRIFWNMNVGGRVDANVVVIRRFVNPNYVFDIELSGGGPLGSSSFTFTDVHSVPSNLGSDHPISILWGFDLTGGNVNVSAQIDDASVVARQFVGVYDSQDTASNHYLELYGDSIVIRGLWTKTEPISDPEYEAFKDSFRRNFEAYVDPDPNCVPPT